MNHVVWFYGFCDLLSLKMRLENEALVEWLKY